MESLSERINVKVLLLGVCRDGGSLVLDRIPLKLCRHSDILRGSKRLAGLR